MLLSKLHYSHYGGVLSKTIPTTVQFFSHNSCTNLFIGGLSDDTNEPVLREPFLKHGDIIEVRVICDRTSGKSKGYGFVKFASEAGATSALEHMNGDILDGKAIRVHQAKKQ